MKYGLAVFIFIMSCLSVSKSCFASNTQTVHEKKNEATKITFKEKVLNLYETIKEWNDKLKPKLIIDYINKLTHKKTAPKIELSTSKKEETKKELVTNAGNNKEKSPNLSAPPPINLPKTEHTEAPNLVDAKSAEHTNLLAPAQNTQSTDNKIASAAQQQTATSITPTQGNTPVVTATKAQEVPLAQLSNSGKANTSLAQQAASQEIHTETAQINKEALPSKQVEVVQNTKIEQNTTASETQLPKLIIVGLKKAEEKPQLQIDPQQQEKEEIAQRESTKFIEDEIAMLTLPHDDDVVLGHNTLYAHMTYEDDSSYIKEFWRSFYDQKDQNPNKKIRNLIQKLNKQNHKIYDPKLLKEYAIAYAEVGDINGLRTIIDHSAIDLLRYKTQNFNLLLAAVASNQYNTTYYLLMRGAAVNRLNRDGSTLLDISEMQNYESLSWLLKEAGSLETDSRNKS